MSELKVVAEAGYFLPLKEIPKETVDAAMRRFHHRIYNERGCQKCPYLEDRHGENCDNCSSFVGARITAKKVVYKGVDYLSIPRGHREIALKLAARTPGVDQIRVVSSYSVAKPRLRPMGLLDDFQMFPYQEEAVETAIKKRRGIIKSPPRSGKTLMGVAIITRIDGKALILAHQREWLVQFRETFYGSETQRGFTDAEPGAVGFAKNLKDFEELDVCLCTFAQFMSEKGKALLAKIRGWFSTIIIDEVHKTAALATSRVLASLSAKYVIGLSGTPARKIEKEQNIFWDLVGPIIYTAEVKKERPTIMLIDTPGTFEYDSRLGRGALTSLQSKLETNKARRTAIIKFAIKHAKAGHLVMIPLTRRRSILEWTRIINEMTERPGFAVPFFGGVPRDMRVKIMTRLRQFKSRIVVGNISMLSTGLNIPRASMLIEHLVTSNMPNAEQRFSRVLTPFEGKPKPVIAYTMDDCEFLRKCRQNEFWNVLVRQLDPIMPADVKSRMMQYLANNGGGRADFFKDV